MTDTNQDKVPDAQSELSALREEFSRLQTQLQKSEIEKARLEERAKAPAAPAQEPAPQETVLTREQLQQAVDAGQITEAQRDEELARQLRESLRKELSQEVDEKRETERQRDTLQSEFDKYLAMKPDIKVEGSTDLARVQEEIIALGKLGYPHDLRTEVLALRNVFGPVDRIQETTRANRETHQETGGSGGGPSAPSEGKDWQKGLSRAQVAAFQKQIETGVYASEDDEFFLKVTTRARTKNVNRAA